MRKVIGILSIPIFCIVLSSSILYAQSEKNANDSLINKIHWYGLKKTSSVLFAHFDKTVYVNNENAWFAVYLLNYDKQSNNPSVLSVILVNDNDRSIALEQQFLMADGLAFGNVFIPDSIPPGDFSFIIYTNELLNGKPRDVFTQAITIKATAEPAVLTSLSLADTAKLPIDGFRKVLFRATTKDGKPIPGAKVVYHIGDNQHPVSSGTVKTDQDGRYLFSIPANQIVAGNNVFEARVNINKELSDLRLVLPFTENKFSIRFYPEGGNLVHGTQSMVGWEAKNADGKPLKVSGLLLKDDKTIDTIESDSYGMGTFKIIPLIGSSYKVRLLADTKDTAYLLPKILPRGPVVTIKKALVTDSLQIRLVSKYPARYYLMVHNYRQVFYSFPAEVGAAGKMVLINLKNIPKGLATITVLDSSQMPCAERLFFAHYNQGAQVIIATDQSTYTTRQKVHLKLKLTALKGDTIKGIVSVACIQSNRTEIKKANDIESYFYLKHDLGELPLKEKYFGVSPQDRDYLENVLLIKGWSRYNWQETTITTASDTVHERNTITFNGAVRHYDKLLRKPYNIMVKTDSSTNIIRTDNTGRFVLNGNNILTAENKKIHLLLNDNGDKYDYSITLPDPFKNSNYLLINGFQPLNYNLISESAVSSDSLTLKGMEHAINLKEVKIKGLQDNNYSQSESLQSFALRKNECGDYVCKYNVLNCPNHFDSPDNRAAVVGESYYVFGAYLPKVYNGCMIMKAAPSVLDINGVNYSKEFYGSDYAQYNPTEPEYLSTIYWKNLCLVNSKGDTDLSFYTSDITGPFKIIVQGISSNSIIYGEEQFNVKNY